MINRDRAGFWLIRADPQFLAADTLSFSQLQLDPCGESPEFLTMMVGSPIAAIMTIEADPGNRLSAEGVTRTDPRRRAKFWRRVWRVSQQLE